MIKHEHKQWLLFCLRCKFYLYFDKITADREQLTHHRRYRMFFLNWSFADVVRMLEIWIISIEIIIYYCRNCVFARTFRLWIWSQQWLWIIVYLIANKTFNVTIEKKNTIVLYRKDIMYQKLRNHGIKTTSNK